MLLNDQRLNNDVFQPSVPGESENRESYLPSSKLDLPIAGLQDYATSPTSSHPIFILNNVTFSLEVVKFKLNNVDDCFQRYNYNIIKNILNVRLMIKIFRYVYHLLEVLVVAVTLHNRLQYYKANINPGI